TVCPKITPSVSNFSLPLQSRAASEEYSLNDSEGGARGFIVEELPDKVAEAEVMRILMVQPVVHFPDGHILVAMEIGDINRRSIRSAFCRLLFDRLPSIHFLSPVLSDSRWQNAGYRAG
ncbi:hypothetical protein, partial [Megasphaera elsdenii]|uniref:hypothetical protein n=1 Tax=Megasphaera elsdenii TaxID=907 RepID=UPI00265FDED0